jgi:hypothetical protein
MMKIRYLTARPEAAVLGYEALSENEARRL